jgi:putative oxidoreductase
MDAGLILGRAVLGVLMAGHGAQKLFGWFGGYGLDGTGGFMEQLGFRPGRFFAAAAGVTELAGGLLTAFGLFGAAGPSLIVCVMVVAAVSAHWPHGLFAQTNGIELPLLYAVGAAVLALTGPGRWSSDAWLGWQAFSTPGFTWSAFAVAIAAAFANLSLRRTPAAVAA